MCVAVVIRGASPSLSDLLDMEAENPHGAGIAWKPDGENRVLYRKGMTALEVSEVLDDLPRPVLLHFRWATHGGVKKALTHPFPLGIAALLDTSLEGQARAVLIHNGIWSDYKRHLPQWAKSFGLSDTAVAAYVAASRPEILKEVHWSTAVGKARGVNRPMLVKLRGDWSEYPAGVKGGQANLFSNLKWRGAASKPKFSYEGPYWNDYFGDGYMVTPAPSRYSTKPKSTYPATSWRKNPLTQVWELVHVDDAEGPAICSTPHRPVGWNDDGTKVTHTDIADALIDATLREVEEDEASARAMTPLNDDEPEDYYMSPEVGCDTMARRRQSIQAYTHATWDANTSRWADPADDDEGEEQQEVYSG